MASHIFFILSMPFLILGIVMLGFGIYSRQKFKRAHDHGGEIGMNALIMAALILILFYGIFDRIGI